MRFDLGSIDKRKLARIIAVVAVALAAGHLVQTVAARTGAAPQSATALADTGKPVEVVQLAGSSEETGQSLPPSAPLPPLAMSVVPELPKAIPTPVFTQPAPEVAAVDPCPVSLDLMADPGAMLGLTLLAPCHPGERVVLRHAGLAVTAMTTASGSLFVALPALESEGKVEVKFADGTAAAASVDVPELAGLRRFGVQWQGNDAFQVYGFEADKTISAASPGLAPSGLARVEGGFLTTLGDAGTANPLMAEIYTYPANAAPDVVVEAAITPATCGREILGETLASVAGSVTITDLTLAMPECDAVGDFLVLKNLAPDLTVTAAN